MGFNWIGGSAGLADETAIAFRSASLKCLQRVSFVVPFRFYLLANEEAADADETDGIAFYSSSLVSLGRKRATRIIISRICFSWISLGLSRRDSVSLSFAPDALMRLSAGTHATADYLLVKQIVQGYKYDRGRWLKSGRKEREREKWTFTERKNRASQPLWSPSVAYADASKLSSAVLSAQRQHFSSESILFDFVTR